MEYRYMIYNNMKKCFQFPSICEFVPELAYKRLLKLIGNDALKWRFEVRKVEKNNAFVIRRNINRNLKK